MCGDCSGGGGGPEASYRVTLQMARLIQGLINLHP